jgi:hypothetical protein
MYGVTHRIADAISEGLTSIGEVAVLSVHDADPRAIGDPDVLLVGAPTQQHGLSLPIARSDVVAHIRDRAPRRLDPDAGGIGVREWLTDLPALTGWYAAFDTRPRKARLLTGSAASQIDRRLHHSGLTRAAPPVSFFVDNGELPPAEVERALHWGTLLAQHLLAPSE